MTEAVDEWLAEVVDWVARQLGCDVDPATVEMVEQRPWGAVLAVPAPAGRAFFKAVGPRGRHETRLLADLADLAAAGTRLTPDLMAVDHDRGWLLMPDHGEAIVHAGLHGQVTVIEELLPRYAELQRTTSQLAGRWIDAGVPDRRPHRLAALLEGLLAGEGNSGPLPIEADEVDRLAEPLDQFRAVCGALEDGGIPPAIDHADIHGTNVLLSRQGSRLIDWGDSCVGHPFSTLLVPIEWVAGRLDTDERAAAVARLVDAYLEPWGRAGDRTVLGRALWAAYVARAVSNDEQGAGGSASDIADVHDEIVTLLRTWRDKSAALDDPKALLAPAIGW